MKNPDIQQEGTVGPGEQNSATPAKALDVRAEKVEALKKQVESGQYQVNIDAVAEKMIKECLFDFNR
jgi:flagellar biosynthesis anti-sigma factor FlgM